MELWALVVAVVSGCNFDSGDVGVPGATWDLSELEALTKGHWHVEHASKTENKPYEYYFGICSDTTFKDGQGFYPDEKMCNNPDEAEWRTSLGFTEKSPAWQVIRDDDPASDTYSEVTHCYRLGHDVEAASAFAFELLDPADKERGYDADPSKGFVLKYSSAGDNNAEGSESECGITPGWMDSMGNTVEASEGTGSAPENPKMGDTWNSENGVVVATWKGNSRDLYLEFQCDEEASTSKPDDNMVFEDPNCTYRILFRSVYGCPSECTRVNEKACAGNGVCGYNRHSQKAQCFCDEGYGGDACGEFPGYCDQAVGGCETEENGQFRGEACDPKTCIAAGGSWTQGTNTSTALEDKLAADKETDSTLVALLVICFILLLIVVAALAYMCFKARKVLQNDKYVGLLGPVDTMNPQVSVNDGGEKL